MPKKIGNFFTKLFKVKYLRNSKMKMNRDGVKEEKTAKLDFILRIMLNPRPNKSSRSYPIPRASFHLNLGSLKINLGLNLKLVVTRHQNFL